MPASRGERAASEKAAPADITQLRAFWADRQCLTDHRNGDVADKVHATGWIPTAGAQLPYVSIFARISGVTRAHIDDAVFGRQDLEEVTTVRGTTMLVPRDEVGLALRAGEPFAQARLDKSRAIGVTDRELSVLGDAILDALRDGPLDTDAIRAYVPAKLVRGLGDAGKKIGDSSTLVIALRQLQRAGRVRREAVDKRLDTSRYEFRLVAKNPLGARGVPDGADAIARALAERFFRWVGAASLDDFAWWAGITKRTAAAACDALSIRVVASLASGTTLMATRADGQALRAARPLASRVQLLPFRDNALGFHRALGALIDPAHARETVLDWYNKRARLGGVAGLHHHALFVNGAIGGIWEYDPAARQVVVRRFGKFASALGRLVDAETERTQRFICDDLGDLRYYAFDTDKQRGPRIAIVRVR